MIKLISVKMIALVSAVFFFTGNGIAGDFSPYRPEIRVTIDTRYRGEGYGVPSEKQWVVSLERKSDDSFFLRFYSQDENEPFCKIHMQKENLRWQETGSSRNRSFENGVLILPGYPVPCDILPFFSDADPLKVKTVTQKKKAGGRTFADTYQISVRIVSADTAKKNGWIKGPVNPDSAGYRLITATDQRNQMAARQLWPEGKASWWIYEETPIRQSWQSGEKGN